MINGGKKTELSVFFWEEACVFSLSSSPSLSLSFPPSETESDQPYFQLEVGTWAQQLFRNVQVDSKWRSWS